MRHFRLDGEGWTLPKSSGDCGIARFYTGFLFYTDSDNLGANYKKILRLSCDVIITYDNRKSNLR